MTVDTIPPTGTISLASGTTYSNVTNPAITLTTDNATQYQLCLNTATVGNNCTSVASAWATYTATPTAYDFAAQGSEILYVQFKDAAGNISLTYASNSITLDSIAPTSSIVSPINNATILSSEVDLTGTSSDTNLSTTTISVDGGAFVSTGGTAAAWTYSATGLSNASHTFQTKATDLAGNTGLSSVISVTVSANIVPSLSIPTSASITATSAILGASLDSLGLPSSISHRGVYFGTTPSPTTSNLNNDSSLTTGVYTVSLPIGTLNPATLYYYRGYATNATGNGYSADGSFTTLSSLKPTVTTEAVTNITMNSATANGTITALGNDTPDKRGIVYSTSSHADPGNVAPASSSYIPNSPEETGSFGIGSFTSNITGLNYGTTYYVRAYSHNYNNYSYGPEVSFTTDAYPLITEAAYRFFDNYDMPGVVSPLALQNANYTLVHPYDHFRLRLTMNIAGSNVPTNALSLKLQYAPKGSGVCDNNFTQTYTDVSSSTPIAYVNNPSVASDQVAMSTNVSDPVYNAETINKQSYVQSSNYFSNSVSSIPIGQTAEWDFSLHDNGNSSASYCMRMVKSDGTLLSTYTVVPEIATTYVNPAGGTSVGTVGTGNTNTGGGQGGGTGGVEGTGTGNTNTGGGQGGGTGGISFLFNKIGSLFNFSNYKSFSDYLLGSVYNSLFGN